MATSRHTKVAAWLLKVGTKGTTLEDLAVPGTGLATLDRKLATALTPTVAGEVMRRINNAKHKALSIDNQLLAGRQTHYMLYEPFRMNKNLGLVHAIADLTRDTWLGVGKKETFHNNREAIIAGMAPECEDAHLTELLPPRN